MSMHLEDFMSINVDTTHNNQSTPWWRHEMETFSASLAIYAGNLPASGEFSTQKACAAELYTAKEKPPDTQCEAFPRVHMPGYWAMGTPR